MKAVLATAALRGTAAVAGTYSSGPIANPGGAGDVICLTHISAVGGTTQSLNVKAQSSPDGSTWTDIPGAAGAALTAIGSNSFNCAVDDDYIQIVAVVGGTGSPTVTYRAVALVVPG